MTAYSNCLTDGQVDLLVDAIDRSEFRSKRDGCRVALVRCMKCARSFEEELEAAKDKIRGRQDFLCLSCDGDASQSSLVRVVEK